MGRPNFFIVGAPKCGTTALYEYLRTHPRVFMPRVKEPHYFATDFPTYRTIHTEPEYLRLFSPARPEQTAVGEASVFYLFSQVAVRNILSFTPDAKLVVMLRNPVELVHSLHSQYLYGFIEDENDFRRAWDLQGARARGEHLPPHCAEPAHLQYAAVGRLGEQVDRLLQQASRDQILFVLMDDLYRSPATVYAEFLRFLDLPHDGRTEFPSVNQNRTHRSETFARFLMRPPFPLNVVKSTLKRAFHLENTRIGTTVYQYNQVRAPRVPLDGETREMLTREFRADIELLSRRIGRNLDHWTEAGAEG
jgi:hypothetical protein